MSKKVVVYGRDQASDDDVDFIDWAGEFGDQYHERNLGAPSSLALFADILGSTDNINSVIEFGAGGGRNLNAIGRLLPKAELTGVEMNLNAVESMQQLPDIHTVHGSIFDWGDPVYDLTLTSGLLIHIDPAHLGLAYDILYQRSKRYICLIEYYNPTPVEVPYRGGILWKRDFAGEMMDVYGLKLVDYGFAYHRDTFKQNDVTWFLMEKRT